MGTFAKRSTGNNHGRGRRALARAGLGSLLTAALAASGAGTAFASPPLAATTSALGDPSSNSPISQSMLDLCYQSPSGPGCTQASLAAINAARSAEGIAPMVLPTNWYSLDAAQQLFVVTNLERTARGLLPATGLSPTLNGPAQAAASAGTDPVGPAGTSWAANWAGSASVLETDFLWMYDDGWGSSNQACTSPSAPGCWGHRHNILVNFGASAPSMGAAVLGQSMTELLAPLGGPWTFTWSQEQPYLPSYSPPAPTSASSTGPCGADTAKVAISGNAVGLAAVEHNGCPGYWLATSTGQVVDFGSAANYGDLTGRSLNAPIIGIASTPDGHGYWLLGADGGVFSFGDARFYGSMGGHPLNKPVVAMTAAPGGQGYWLVGADGGVFSFGDARFYGSMGGHPLNKPVVAMTAAPGGQGYWLVGADGGVFSFGDARFYGSMGGHSLNKPVVAMTAAPGGQGYRVAASDGGIFSFGAPFYGSLGTSIPSSPISAMASSPTAKGYYLLEANGAVASFGDAPYLGSGY